MSANLQFTTHQLAKELLKFPDVPVAVGRDLGAPVANIWKLRIAPDGKLLFEGDEPVEGETVQDVFWITGAKVGT